MLSLFDEVTRDPGSGCFSQCLPYVKLLDVSENASVRMRTEDGPRGGSGRASGRRTRACVKYFSFSRIWISGISDIPAMVMVCIMDDGLATLVIR